MVDDRRSKLVSVVLGVLQGSVLCPLLFLDPVHFGVLFHKQADRLCR